MTQEASMKITDALQMMFDKMEPNDQSWERGTVRGAAAYIGSLERQREKLEGAVAYAHGRLQKMAPFGLGSEDACPTRYDMPESLRRLANERAGWIEVAIDHNLQCPQLNPSEEELPSDLHFHPVDVAAAVYTFAAWLTLREEVTHFGETCDAARVAELVDLFCKYNEMADPDMSRNTYQHPEEGS